MSQRFEPMTLHNRRSLLFVSLFDHALTLFTTLTIVLLLGMPILTCLPTDFFLSVLVVSFVLSAFLLTLEIGLRRWSPNILGVRRFILHEHGLTRLPGPIEYGRDVCQVVVQLDPHGDYADDNPTPLYHVQMVARKRASFDVWLTEADVAFMLMWASACQVAVDDRRNPRDDERTP